MKYAVIKSGGKQYKVHEGQTLSLELLEAVGKEVTFSEVLLVADGEKIEVGTPTVPGMTVSADILGEVKGDKIQVFKFKSKSRYRRLTGHRQKFTSVKITAIGAKSAAKPAAKPAAAKKPAAKKTVAKKAAPKKAVK